MAILLFDYLCVRVCMFVPACHSGLLEGYYFSMTICMFVWKNIEDASKLAGMERCLKEERGMKMRRRRLEGRGAYGWWKRKCVRRVEKRKCKRGGI